MVTCTLQTRAMGTLMLLALAAFAFAGVLAAPIPAHDATTVDKRFFWIWNQHKPDKMPVKSTAHNGQQRRSMAPSEDVVAQPEARAFCGSDAFSSLVAGYVVHNWASGGRHHLYGRSVPQIDGQNADKKDEVRRAFFGDFTYFGVSGGGGHNGRRSVSDSQLKPALKKEGRRAFYGPFFFWGWNGTHRRSISDSARKSTLGHDGRRSVSDSQLTPALKKEGRRSFFGPFAFWGGRIGKGSTGRRSVSDSVSKYIAEEDEVRRSADVKDVAEVSLLRRDCSFVQGHPAGQLYPGWRGLVRRSHSETGGEQGRAFYPISGLQPGNGGG